MKIIFILYFETKIYFWIKITLFLELICVILYKTVNDDETSMSINIYEEEKRYVKYNHLLKQSNIDGLTPRPKGKTKVVIEFDIDVNGILNVQAKEESPDGNGKIINLSIKLIILIFY